MLNSGYVEQGSAEKACPDSFTKMQRKGDLLLHIAMLVCVLKAGGTIGDVSCRHRINFLKLLFKGVNVTFVLKAR